MSVFYDDLLGLDEVHNELLDFDLPTREHYHILELADSTLHHNVLSTILGEIPPENHEYFLVQFNNRPDDSGHYDYLKQYNPQIEEKIRESAQKTKSALLAEIRNLKS